ncbi:M23 family metallopeptidase [Nitrospira sp. Kam-Ns4a]
MTGAELQADLERRRRFDRLTIMAVVLLASVFPVELFPGPPRDLRGTDGQFSGKQGQVVLVRVPVETGPAEARSPEITGRFLGREIPFFPASAREKPGGYVGLLGIDLEDAPGTHELAVAVKTAEGTRTLSYNVLVIKERYPVQRLTLPKDKVDLDQDSLVRVKAEQQQVRTVLDQISRERFWRGPFIEPVHGPVAGSFGQARIINGQPRTPHNGEDIAAPLGAEVVATNDGVVRLTVDHFFSGKGVYLDHGLGLYSMYFHLSEIAVREGEPVKRGQVIGRVGASGRVSGPHLHWAVRVNGARVDPYALLKLPFAEEASAAP